MVASKFNYHSPLSQQAQRLSLASQHTALSAFFKKVAFLGFSSTASSPILIFSYEHSVMQKSSGVLEREEILCGQFLSQNFISLLSFVDFSFFGFLGRCWHSLEWFDFLFCFFETVRSLYLSLTSPVGLTLDKSQLLGLLHLHRLLWLHHLIQEHVWYDDATWSRRMFNHLSRLCLPHSPIHTDLPTPNLKINFHSQKLMLWCFEGRVTSWLAILRASSTDSIAAKLT